MNPWLVRLYLLVVANYWAKGTGTMNSNNSVDSDQQYTSCERVPPSHDFRSERRERQNKADTITINMVSAFLVWEGGGGLMATTTVVTLLPLCIIILIVDNLLLLFTMSCFMYSVGHCCPVPIHSCPCYQGQGGEAVIHCSASRER